MTQEQKLTAIISKVIENGYKGFTIEAVEHIESADIPYIIFSHDFCKAIFGEEYIHEDVVNWDEVSTMITKSTLAWQFHGQQLFLTKESERINYLFDFIKDEK